MSDMNFNRSPVVAVGCGCKNKQNFTTLIQFRYCKEIYSNLDYIYSLAEELLS